MARRWRDSGAFRADPAALAAPRPTRRQSVALMSVLVLLAGAVAVASYLVRPERARAFDLFSGSVFLADSVAPVAVDLATGTPSVRLIGATAQVGATPQQSPDLSVTPLAPGGGTLLLDRVTGEFNMVDATGFVVKRTGGGVPLPRLPGSASGVSSIGMAADDASAPDLAYIEQAGRTHTAVYLVSEQTVRDAAAGTRVAPRAARTLDVTAGTGPGTATTANGNLWLLTGGGAEQRLVQLSLPARSTTGATLAETGHGTVSGPAALGSARASGPAVEGTDGQPSVVGLATADRIEVFAPGAAPAGVRFTAPGRIDSILPVTDQTGRLTFLLHGSAGWSIVSVGADGTHLRGPTPISDIAGTSSLIEPAASGDSLYTLDTASAQVIRIGMDGSASLVPGAQQYPVALNAAGHPIEPAGRYTDTYVIARGSRVIYDSPDHLEALALFTDDSHAPVVIQKNSAVGLDASGDAAALSRSRNQAPSTGKHAAPGTTPPKQRTAPAVNTTIDCQNTTQKPHIPQIAGVQSAARSVTFSWLYPRINNQDCVPRTYIVTTTLVGGNAPPPPGPVTVQDQQSVTLTGLYPSSSYDVTVTAYLGTSSTTSRPYRVTTSAQGPDAPTGVLVHADSAGNWVLSWDSCGPATPSCVPSGSWEIQPRICDGKGLVGSLSPLDVPADPTTRQQPPAVYHGGTSLLGRGLSFQVMGRGLDNLPGTFSASTSCVYSWAPPIPSALALTASQPAETSFGGSTSTNVTLNLGADPVRDVGGVGARVTFTLTGDGSTQTRGPYLVTGSQSTIAADFAGVRAGAAYRASASVTPAHGGTPITVRAARVSTRSQWPAISVDPSCPSAFLACNLSVAINGVSSAASRGELFSLTDASQVKCGAFGRQLTKTDFDPSRSTVNAVLSQLAGFYGSDCSVTIQLVEASPGPLSVYGGIPSPAVTRAVDFGPPDDANVGKGDLDVQWATANGQSAARVMYTGSQNLNELTTGWTETVTAPDGLRQCGSAGGSPPGGSAGTATYVTVPSDCVQTYGAAQGNWTVTVHFTNRADNSTGGPFTYQLPNPPPTYQPCIPSGLNAAWGATQADGIAVSVDNSAQLVGCSGWHYTVLDGTQTPPAQVCLPATTLADGHAPQQLTIDTTLCGVPVADGWILRIGWNDAAGNPQTSDIPLGPPPST